MALTQLDPTLPVITDRGTGYAFAVIDYGQEHHLLWVVALDNSGEIWTIPNPNVRVQNNYTMGRTGVTPVLPIKPKHRQD